MWDGGQFFNGQLNNSSTKIYLLVHTSVLPSLVGSEPRPDEVNINVFLLSSRGLTHTHLNHIWKVVPSLTPGPFRPS